jgi:hypothetical protein
MPETIHEVDNNQTAYDYYFKRFNVATQQYDTTDQGSAVRQWQDVLDGVKNAYWRDQIRSMSNASTSVTATRVRLNIRPDFSDFAGWVVKPPPPAGHQSADYRAENAYGYGVVNNCSSFGLPDPNALSTLSAQNQAASQLAQQIDSLVSGVNLGETIGEIRETVGTLRRPLNSLRTLLTDTTQGLLNIARGIRGGRVKKVDIPKVIGDTYLEFRFGWNPLVSDIAKTYVEATSDRMGFSYIPVRCRGRSFATVQSENQSGVGISSWRIVRRDTSEVEVRYKGVIRVEPTSIYAQLGPTWGLLPHQYPATVWNCLPWSFVADYFVNVGQMIQSWCSPIPNFVFFDRIAVLRSKREYVVTPYTTIGDFGGVPELTTSVPGYFNVDWFVMSRTPSGFPYVQPELNIPDFGSRPWYNLGALALANATKVERAMARAMSSR